MAVTQLSPATRPQVLTTLIEGVGQSFPRRNFHPARADSCLSGSHRPLQPIQCAHPDAPPHTGVSADFFSRADCHLLEDYLRVRPALSE